MLQREPIIDQCLVFISESQPPRSTKNSATSNPGSHAPPWIEAPVIYMRKETNHSAGVYLADGSETADSALKELHLTAANTTGVRTKCK